MRDKQILAMRLAQRSLVEIAEEFRISASTVKTSLDRTQRRVFQDHGIDKVIQELLPKAFAAVAAKLESGEGADLGMRILETLGVVGRAGEVAPALQDVPLGATGATATFEEYRRTVIHGTPPTPAPEPPTVVVEVVPTPVAEAQPYAHLNTPATTPFVESEPAGEDEDPSE